MASTSQLRPEASPCVCCSGTGVVWAMFIDDHEPETNGAFCPNCDGLGVTIETEYEAKAVTEK